MARAPVAKSFDIRRKEIRFLKNIPLPSQVVSCITALSDERLLITNPKNVFLTMIDTRSNLRISDLELWSNPWDVCLVSCDKAVITLPFEEFDNMQFICIGDTNLSLVNSISVAGDCYGVDCYEDTLFVCYGTQTKIEAMTMDGTVVNEVSNKTVGKYIFNSLKYIKVHEIEGSLLIYASDAKRFTITQLNQSLEILKIFDNPKLKGPFGLEVVDFTQLLVCGKDCGTIFVLDISNGEIATLLQVPNPVYVCFCRDMKKLYVGLSNWRKTNYVREYDIK